MQYVKGILAGCALLVLFMIAWAAFTLIHAVREVRQEVAELKASTQEMGAKIAEASQAIGNNIAEAKGHMSATVSAAKDEIRAQTSQAREFITHQTKQAQDSLHRQEERLKKWNTYLCETSRGNWYTPPWCKEVEGIPSDS
jgi:F0F1-type ATP synthase membrane subunit b/b'